MQEALSPPAPNGQCSSLCRSKCGTALEPRSKQCPRAQIPQCDPPLYTPHIQEGFSPGSLNPLERQDKRGLFPTLLLITTGKKEAAVPVFGH